MGEAEFALNIFSDRKCHHAMLVSSPTHLPRCLVCACKAVEQRPALFDGPIFASPSDTSWRPRQVIGRAQVSSACKANVQSANRAQTGFSDGTHCSFGPLRSL